MTDIENIRSLFLHPRPTYTVPEAAKLLGVHPGDLRRWMDTGEIEPLDSPTGPLVPWPELVSFGIDFWSQEHVENTLGAEAADVIPDLLRLTAFEIRIPLVQILALQHLAARNATTVNTLLARELRDLVSTHSEWLSHELVGFAHAFAWPEVCPRGQRETRAHRRFDEPRDRARRHPAAAPEARRSRRRRGRAARQPATPECS